MDSKLIFHQYLKTFELHLWIGIIAFSLFGVIDYLMIENADSLKNTLYVRFAFPVTAYFILLMFVSFRRNVVHRNFGLFSFLACFVTVVSIEWFLRIALKSFGTYFHVYYASLIMVVIVSPSAYSLLKPYYASYTVVVIGFFIGLLNDVFYPFISHVEFSVIVLVLLLSLLLSLTIRNANERNLERLYLRGRALKLEIKRKKTYFEGLLANDRLKSRIISVISHDVRGPLSNIQQSLELFLSNSIDVHEFRKISMLIDRNIHVTKGIIEDVLEWVKSDGHSHNSERLFMVEKCLREVSNLYVADFEKKNIEFAYDCASAGMLVTRGDVFSLVVRNLISNSIKFTENGKISVSVEFDNMFSMLVCTVSDTGRGISFDINPYLVSVKSPKSTIGTQGENGKGLGLLLCSECLQNIGGKIRFIRKSGKGAIFEFRMPATAYSQAVNTV